MHLCHKINNLRKLYKDEVLLLLLFTFSPCNPLKGEVRLKTNEHVSQVLWRNLKCLPIFHVIFQDTVQHYSTFTETLTLTWRPICWSRLSQEQMWSLFCYNWSECVRPHVSVHVEEPEVSVMDRLTMLEEIKLLLFKRICPYKTFSNFGIQIK